MVAAGLSYNGNDNDFLTIRYDAGGTVLWRAVAHSTQNRHDRPTRLVTDAAGNVYVTGLAESFQAQYLNDALVVKYDADGVLQWRAEIDYANGADYAVDIVVDTAGNTYVLARSDDAQGYPVFLTVKFNAAGQEIWRRATGGAAQTYSTPFAMRAMPGGGVLVTGQASASPDSYFLTVRYDDAGAVTWQTATQAAGKDMYPGTLTIDSLGRAVIGGFQGAFGDPPEVFFVVLDTSGAEVRRTVIAGLPGSAASNLLLDADAAGNTYAAISSNVGFTGAATTIKYGSDGSEVWRRVLTLPGDVIPSVRALAVTGAGLVNVTALFGDATSRVLSFQYDTAGTEQWRQELPNPTGESQQVTSLTIDGGGNVYIGGSMRVGNNSNDFLVAKYSQSGVHQWLAGAGAHGEIATTFGYGKSLATDSANNTYIAGRSFFYEMVLVKLDAAGNIAWQVTDQTGEPKKIAVDAAGNVFVLAYHYDAVNKYDWLVVKYSPTGVETWRRTVSGPAGKDDFPGTLAVTAAGEVYVAGSFELANGYALAIAKFDAAGNELWRNSITGDGYTTAATALAVDGSGNAWLAGTLDTGGISRLLVAKFTSAGAEAWRRLLDGEQEPVMAVDAAGHAHVAFINKYTGVAGDPPGTAIKYDAAGNVVWRVPLPDIAPSALVLDSAGNVLVAGQAFAPLIDFATVKLNRDGGQQWRTANGTAPTRDWVYGIATDTGGNVYLAGISRDTGFGDPAELLVKLDSAGTEQWRTRDRVTYPDGPEHRVNVAVTPAGNVVLGGRHNPPATSPAMAVSARPAGNGPLALIAAFARKRHAAGPAFDVGRAPGVAAVARAESRDPSGGVDVVIVFNRTVTGITSISAAVAGVPVVLGNAVMDGNELRVPLPVVPPDSRVDFNLTGLNGSLDATFSVGFLKGDLDGSGRVTAADLSAAKARVGRPVLAATAAGDINADGILDGTDVAAVRIQTGKQLP